MSQTIKAGQDALVVMSGGDTNIGMSPEQMKQIIEALADQMPKYAAVASAIVEQRLSVFENKVMERFASADLNANPEAFADPDFQYLVGRAQQSFARSGDDVTAELLVDLIAERSARLKRSRLSLTLNDAIEKSAVLTENELAELSLVFCLRYTQAPGTTSFPALCELLATRAGALLNDISTEPSSYSYLQAQGCATTTEVSTAGFFALCQAYYGGLLCLGVEKSVFEGYGNPELAGKIMPFVIPCLHDRSKYQLDALTPAVLKDKLDPLGIGEHAKDLWQLQMPGMMSVDQFLEKATPLFPEIRKLQSLWDQETPMKQMTLTSVGIAIGYANLRRSTPFQADLSIWIK